MKLQKRSVTLLFLLFIVESQCGLIDNIYGRVKNTTSGLTQDVKNVWSYGKGIIGLESKNNEDVRPEEEKRGLIGGIVHTAREKVHSFRNYFWNTDEYSTDAGVFGNMYNRVKTRLLKVHVSILEDNKTDAQITEPLSKKAQVVRDALNKLFFGNGTRQVHGKAFREAIENLRNKLYEIRNNMTVSTTKSPVNHGEGLIDVRTAVENVEDTINDNAASINNNVYDKVEDNINVASDKAANSYNRVKENLDNGFDITRNGINNAKNGLKDKISDATVKENEMLGNALTNINVDAKNAKDKVQDTLEDLTRLSY